MSNLGRWAAWYTPGVTQAPYGASPSYELAAEWLDGLHIEDWGCGRGWLRHFVPPDRYTGVDGTESPWADVVDDLAVRVSDVDGIAIRHVLEHDQQWRTILVNACRSARRRIFLAVFTPAGRNEEIGRTAELDVPDLALSSVDIERVAVAAGWSIIRHETIDSPQTFYRAERCWWLERC